MKIKHLEINTLSDAVIIKNKACQDQLQFLYKTIKEYNKVLDARYSSLKAWYYDEENVLTQEESDIINKAILLTETTLDNKLYKTLSTDYLENYVKELNEIKEKLILLEKKNVNKIKINGDKIEIIPLLDKNKPIKISKKEYKNKVKENQVYNEIKSKKAYAYKFDEKYYQDLERLEVLSKLSTENFYNEINEELRYTLNKIKDAINLINNKIANLIDEDKQDFDYEILRKVK